MEKLFHLSTINKYLTWFEDDWEKIDAFSKKHQMDGVELGLTPDYDISKIPSGIVKGVHLSFYPMWLEFWQGDLALLKQILGSEEAIIDYYGGLQKEVMVESYRSQYERAKALGAKYMVFHVSHIRIEDSFTMKYDYTDEQVIDATIELLNASFPVEADGPKLLFENLWWPGLTFTRVDMVKRLLDGVQYPNTGLLMDISHLTLTNPKIKHEQDCYQYVRKIVDSLGDLKERIEGVHLNKTLPRDYMVRNHDFLLDKYRKAPNQQQANKVLKAHVQKMDPHQPFDHEIAKKILAYINPTYCVYETNPSSIYEMAHFIIRQNKALQ